MEKLEDEIGFLEPRLSRDSIGEFGKDFLGDRAGKKGLSRPSGVHISTRWIEWIRSSVERGICDGSGLVHHRAFKQVNRELTVQEDGTQRPT